MAEWTWLQKSGRAVASMMPAPRCCCRDCIGPGPCQCSPVLGGKQNLVSRSQRINSLIVTTVTAIFTPLFSNLRGVPSAVENVMTSTGRSMEGPLPKKGNGSNRTGGEHNSETPLRMDYVLLFSRSWGSPTVRNLDIQKLLWETVRVFSECFRIWFQKC